jgi:hypothetical protein
VEVTFTGFLDSAGANEVGRRKPVVHELTDVAVVPLGRLYPSCLLVSVLSIW